MSTEPILLTTSLALTLPGNLLATTNSTTANQSNNSLKHWLIRGRIVNVNPDVSSKTISTIGGKVSHVSNQVIPELDFSYFFTSHIAMELILGTSKHHLIATGTAVGSVDLGTVRILPPTITLQYHFFPKKKFNPYLGAGINYTYFYNSSTNSANTAVQSIDYKNNLGFALQAGIDYNLNQSWSINLDVKKLFVKTTATVNLTGGGTAKADVHLDPYVYGIGVGYRF
ncbi:OmpW/AlkL family protein [Piscirickettsia salmonis]|uniref:OmpW/AlkL family protein n=1 Tax=Piscirickettsia salmonis TaxID=1238 RepID=UPI0012BA76A6|nr:OmpW family outer membrane protein [Piscirickettsia salmonis]QGP39298.1 Outer membrane protein W precursor [Piscirickettsia salmonis]